MDMLSASRCRCFRGLRLPGSARVSRVGLDVASKQAFFERDFRWLRSTNKVRNREDAFASTRDACAIRIDAPQRLHPSIVRTLRTQRARRADAREPRRRNAASR